MVAVCAVILAPLRLLMRDPKRFEELLVPILWSALMGGVVVMVFGLLLGLFHTGRLRGLAWGALVGGLLGGLCGPILFIPVSEFPLLLLTSLGGALVILGTATVIRLSTGHTADTASSDRAQPARTRPQRHPLDPDPNEEEG